MHACRLLWTSLTTVAYADAIFCELSLELLSEGLVSLKEDGIPTTECVISSKFESATTQPCIVTAGFDPRSVGCFTIFNGTTVMQQGCYSTQEVAMRSQCKKRVCSAGRKHRGISFCCCFGDRCNAD